MTSSDRQLVYAGVAAGALAAAWWYWNAGSSSAPADAGSSIGGDVHFAAGQVLDAIQNFENVATQHNNPGGICGGFDSSGNCLGPATFPTLQAGIDAATSKISTWLNNNPAITVEQFVAKWSGATGDVLTNYVNSVANALQLDPSDPIALAGGGDDGSD